MANTEIILKGGQFIRRSIIEEDLGSQEKLLYSCATSAGTCLKKLIPFEGGFINVLAGQQNVTLYTPLKELPFKTYFELSERDPKLLVPVYRNHEGAILMDEPWPVPADYPLYFVSRYTRDQYSAYYQDHCYLMAYYNKEFRKIPYPNVFDDGRICMGNTWDNNPTTGQGIFADFKKAYDSFHTTAMNDHLVITASFTYFNKDADTGKWIAPVDGVSSGLSMISSSVMAGFIT